MSSLSPWIRHRSLLETEILREVLKKHSYATAEKFIQEVFWRTYWKGWLELRPDVWSTYCGSVRDLTECSMANRESRKKITAAYSGDTGIGCFDSWVKELITHGYLHNHARMWFASIWIFWLGIPWQLGADFFLQNLLDGDPATNTLSWRWVAGLHTKGKVYLPRPDNIKKFTGGRFSPIKQPLNQTPSLYNEPPPPRQLDIITCWNKNRQTGLLLTEDDMLPEFLGTPTNDFRCCAILNSSNHRSPIGISKQVAAFVNGGLQDSLTNFLRLTQIPQDHVFQTESVDRLALWLAKVDIEQIVVAYAPVGPAQEALDLLDTKLLPLGIDMVRVLRREDSIAWPHATKGFFKFKEKIPSFLKDINNCIKTAT